jgi:hypothetical protein
VCWAFVAVTFVVESGIIRWWIAYCVRLFERLFAIQ